MEDFFAGFELAPLQKIVDKGKFLKGRLKQASIRDNPQPIEIDVDYLLRLGKKQNWKCALTGIDLQFVSGKGKKNPYICTIDRIDSNKGYVKKNVQLLCWIANQCKGKYNQKEFIEMCVEVAKHKGCK